MHLLCWFWFSWRSVRHISRYKIPTQPLSTGPNEELDYGGGGSWYYSQGKELWIVKGYKKNGQQTLWNNILQGPRRIQPARRMLAFVKSFVWVAPSTQIVAKEFWSNEHQPLEVQCNDQSIWPCWCNRSKVWSISSLSFGPCGYTIFLTQKLNVASADVTEEMLTRDMIGKFKGL
jgi:hypothetical protein